MVRDREGSRVEYILCHRTTPYVRCGNSAFEVSCLIEEYVFPVTAFCREVFEVTILTDTVLLAELLPKLAPNCLICQISMPSLRVVTIRMRVGGWDQFRECVPLLPHWPACIVIISLRIALATRHRATWSNTTYRGIVIRLTNCVGSSVPPTTRR